MPSDADGAEREATRAPPPDEHGASADRLRIHPVIDRLTRWLALGGGTLVLFTVALTLVSVIGRYGLNRPLPGDYETVELVCAVGIFLFFPYVHATEGNIVVRFFTVAVSARHNRMLDLAHEFVFAAVAALLTWRLSIGFLERLESGESTMLIRIPLWWSYGIAVVSLALLFVVCVARIDAGIKALRR
jgi:TRAP-type C4-dicarboxylate transport system permease small subunit